MDIIYHDVSLDTDTCWTPDTYKTIVVIVFDYRIVPDKVTTSLMLSPTLSNLDMIVSSVSNGEGIARFARVLFDTNPSLRPCWTYQKGPPLYTKMWS
jgi:hypothetical protein